MTAGPSNNSQNIMRAAEAGNVDAQCELGMMYEHGLGVPKDYQGAIFWYRTAADRGSGYAAYKIALMFENGHGVQPDLVMTANWLKRAAECGIPEAQYKLAVMLETGRGINQRWAEAATWYLQAANQGVVDAAFRLGFLYEHGQGVQRDLRTAAHYYKFAADRGNSNAQYNLAVLYVTGEDIEENLGEATRLFECAAQAGHARAKAKFNQAMEAQAKTTPREAIKKEEDEHPKWWQRKEELHNKEETAQEFIISTLKQTGIMSGCLAIYSLTPTGEIFGELIKHFGWIFFIVGLVMAVGAGFGFFYFIKNKQDKPDYFQMGTVGVCALVGLIIMGCVGFSTVQLTPMGGGGRRSVIGSKHEHLAAISQEAASQSGKRGVTRSDVIKQVRQMESAQKEIAEESQNARETQTIVHEADRGNPTAQEELGSRYESGNGIDQSDKEALTWYTKAAKNDDKPAETRLGVMYKRTGEDGVPNYSEARKWLTKAATQDKYAPAQYQLALMYEFGEGINKDMKTAADWYGKAAAQNDSYAQYRLGLFNENGWGMPKDLTAALKWFNLSAAQENWMAERKLGDLYSKGEGVNKDSTEAAKYFSRSTSHHKKGEDRPGSAQWLHETVEDKGN